jgi:hypothetical protein
MLVWNAVIHEPRGHTSMSGLLSEKLVSFAAAAQQLPPRDSDGEPISAATVWRWSKVGLLSRSGQRIKLRSIRVGGKSMTSWEEIERFFVALTEEEPVHA